MFQIYNPIELAVIKGENKVTVEDKTMSSFETRVNIKQSRSLNLKIKANSILDFLKQIKQMDDLSKLGIYDPMIHKRSPDEIIHPKHN